MEKGDLFPYWAKTAEETARFLETDLKEGLTWDEAKKRLQEVGENALPKAKRTSAFLVFLRQFSSPLIWLLLAAACIAALLGEWIQCFAILAILFLNSWIGFFQEFRAEKSFESLRSYFVPKATVIREGKSEEIAATEIVPGDLVRVEAGTRVPADGRVVYAAELTVEEAPLTGESSAVYKNTEAKEAEMSDRKSALYLGTEVVKGKGLFLVARTGLKTELGKIAGLLNLQEEKKTPLQGRLSRLSHHLIYLALFLVAILFCIGILENYPWVEMLLISVSLAVAAVPEGLPAIVTIALAIGVQKMAKRKALIRRLSSVETLGSTSVICSDKTGTLTQNQMTVRSIWTSGKLFEVEGVGYEPKGSILFASQPVKAAEEPDLVLALEIGLLCNDAELIESKEGWKIQGDPTEGALIVAAAKLGMVKSHFEEQYPPLHETPFDSERKRMSVLRKNRRLYVKGAPDVLLNLSTSFHEKGKRVFLEEEKRKALSQEVLALSKKGLRVLALAYRDLEDKGEGKLEESFEKDLTLVAFANMIDPPRIDVKEAIEKCKEAHILPVMITGDHFGTAVAIAKEVGLTDTEERALWGFEVNKLSDLELKEAALSTFVYARTSAEHKMRIIEAFKKNKMVVAMTGDGVNDAPAIKKADIGIAMGITGTDVTKGAADMVLLDDSFSTIVHAVEEGRAIFDNIAKFVFFLLSANLGEIFAVFFGVVIGFTLENGSHVIPLLPAQILWVNLVTDGLPGVALAFDPIAPGVMRQKPRKIDAPFLTIEKGIQLICIGALLGGATLIAAYVGFRKSVSSGQTMAFTGLVLFELLLVWLIRLPLLPNKNRLLFFAVVSSLGLQLAVVYVPFLQKMFSTVALNWEDWGVLSFLGAGVVFVCYAILKAPKWLKRQEGTCL